MLIRALLKSTWVPVTFLFLLFLYETSVAVLRGCCYVSFATVHFIVHLVALGGNDGGGNDSARREVQWYNRERMLPVSVCIETACVSNEHPGSAAMRE